MFPNNTAAYLTEGLANIFHLDQKGGSKYQSINSMMYTWQIETNYIKRIEFAAVPEGDGSNGTEITMAFRERYYGKYDTFKIEKSGQQCFCVTNPVRRADNYWEQTVRLVNNSYDVQLDFSACQPGDTTRWISNFHPELHEKSCLNYLVKQIYLISGNPILGNQNPKLITILLEDC